MKRRRYVLYAMIVTAVSIAAILMLRYALQRSMIFPRHLRRAEAFAANRVPGLERVELQADGARVEAWILPGRGASKEAPGPALMFAHGNAELIDDWPEVLEGYRAMGITVMLPEYRGYGRSTGSPSEAAIVEDYVAFYDRLAARPEVDPARIVFHGRSLGGGVVSALASRRKPRAMILMSTFTSVLDIARGWGAPGFLIPDKFDSLSVVRTLDVPILIMHGRYDRLIPFEHAERLAKEARRAELVPDESDHNDCPRDWGAYFQRAKTFLRAAGVLFEARTEG